VPSTGAGARTAGLQRQVGLHERILRGIEGDESPQQREYSTTTIPAGAGVASIGSDRNAPFER
jgi:hypothetical protein